MCLHLLVPFLLFYCFTLFAQEFELDDDRIDFKEEIFASKQQTKHEKAGDIIPFDLTLSAECEPFTSVGGCVNVLSGHFFQIEKDLKGNTIEPLDIIRYYDSGNKSESFLGVGFGCQFPLWASDVLKGARHHHALISEREGFLLPYRDKEGGPSNTCLIDPLVLKKGYTNLSRAAISGHANFINWRAVFRNSKDSSEDEWFVQLGDGTQRIYDKCVKIDGEQQAKMNFPSKTAYLLTKEIKPNGNQLLFSYQTINGKPRLTQVKTLNRTGKKTLNELKFHYLLARDIDVVFHHRPESCTISTPYGDRVEYHQVKGPHPVHTGLGIRDVIRKFLVKTTSSQKGTSQYEMAEYKWKIEKINRPENRYTQVAYDSSGRVKAIYEPLETKEPIKCYEFDYHKDSTDVRDALGQLTTYHFDDHERLSHIDYFKDRHDLVRQDCFEWSQRPGEEGWLKSKSIQNGLKITYLKTFRYDTRGNIISEAIYGNLTGEKPETFTLSQKQQMDRSFILYKYSHEGHNLLKEKSTPEGLVISYDYLVGTNLCTKTLCKYEGKIQERSFRTYDDNGQLQTLVEDDGSGEKESDLTDVTSRKIKQIEAVTYTGAAFGKPKRIYEYYRDHQTGYTTFLRETLIAYDDKGCEKERKFYDSQGNLHCKLTKKYDERVLLREETNALGETIRYIYDDSDNKNEEELIGSGKKTCYDYDLANRLIKKEEIHDNGDLFVTAYKVNPLNQLTSETDPYGQTTHYKYDRLGNQIECIKPLQDCDGKTLSPTIHKKYNCLNQLIAKKDENGHETKYTYNVYGSPTKITYPDKAEEHFTYTLSGWLKEKRNPDGTSISYDYDAKGHLVEETFFNQQKQPIKKETTHYKGSLLQSKIDAMGLEITYEYDGAGRKIVEKIGDLKTIHYAYDDFDRLIKKEQDGRQEIFEYDPLDRLTSKTLQAGGHIYAKETYAYDIHGNQHKKTIWQTQHKNTIWQTQNKQSTYLSHYNSDNTLQWKEDPLKSRTTWEYHHRHTNELGQQVQARTILDPLARPTRETDDAFHRLATRSVYTGNKEQSCTHFTYDPMGHLIKQHALVMENGRPIREYSILRHYNNRGLLESEIEMPHGKTTHYLYDSMERLEKKVKPDGITLHYTYDPLGRVETLRSSDRTIHYTYHYDLHDNLTQIEDHVHNLTQIRKFDLWDRLEYEVISPEITIYYTYDQFDRPKSMTLPNVWTVLYDYDSYHLKKIQYFKAGHRSLIEIECSYDLQGNLIETCSNVGKITYSYDPLGRFLSIKSSFWEEHLEKYDLVGNLTKIKQKDPGGIFQGNFAYDRFNHLCLESAFSHEYSYDSIGNCLKKGNKTHTINTLNQLENDQETRYSYDANGNLKTQSSPQAAYTYDALNRLISCEKEGKRTTFLYDSFGRCLQITDPTGTKQLLYQGDQEIGSLLNGQLQEFRLIHPEPRYDLTLAIELQEKIFFPIQDCRGNICALQIDDTSLAEWTRYSAFGEKVISGDLQGLFNPWRFANKREVADLSLFPHRFYNPRIMRWQTTDPLGFEDSLNLYAYVHNNPFRYKDPDGRIAFAIPFVVVTFDLVVTWLTVETVVATAATVGLSVAVYQANKHLMGKNTEVYAPDRPLPQDKDGKPIPDADTPHTQLGTGSGRKGKYPQAREFDEYGKPVREVHFTDHGRPHDHPNPHQHRREENPTGGTRTIERPEPLKGWNY